MYLPYNIVKGMLKYCYRLENIVEFPLLKDAFLCNKHLHYNLKTSWYSTIVKLFNILNMGCNTMSLGKGDFNSTLKKLLSSKYLTDWKYNYPWLPKTVGLATRSKCSIPKS